MNDRSWITWAIAPGAGWIRFRRWMLRWTAHEPLFSERNGYRMPFLRIGKVRFFWCQ